MPLTRIALGQLSPIVADYQAAFPEWQLVGKDLLVRSGRFTAQAIWFDRLRTGAYRPTCRVHILTAPGQEGGTAVLGQFLNVRIRELTLQGHVRSFSVMVDALKTEIIPSVVRPLHDEGVVELLLVESVGRPVNAYALACLLSALGKKDDAIRWMGEYRKAVIALELPPQPVDLEEDSFLRKIEGWFDLPDRDARFAEVVHQQKSLLLGLKA